MSSVSHQNAQLIGIQASRDQAPGAVFKAAGASAMRIVVSPLSVTAVPVGPAQCTPAVPDPSLPGAPEL